MLDDLTQEEGTPMELSSGAKDMGEDVNAGKVGNVPTLPLMISQAKQIVSNVPPHPQFETDFNRKMVSKGNVTAGDQVASPTTRTPDSGKNSKVSDGLGLQKKSLKKGPSEKLSKIGHKTDQEKVKLMGDTLVESGSVKTIDSHFSQVHK